jgi:hypothetical protein
MNWNNEPRVGMSPFILFFFDGKKINPHRLKAVWVVAAESRVEAKAS